MSHIPDSRPPDLPPECSELISRLIAQGYNRRDLHLRPELCRFLVTLDSEGFSVIPTGRKDKPKGSIRIEWNDQYLAYSVDLPNKHERLIGYQFNPGQPNSKNACPPDFDLTNFCRLRGYSPSSFAFYPENGVHEKYLHMRDFDTALDLMRESAAAVDPTYEPPESRGRDATLERDLEALRRDKTIPDNATYKQLYDARRGQGKYRKDLEDIFGARCVVSGLQLRAVLRASHILAWSLCSSCEQKLDPNNGLLLAANLDALFDRYLITFATDGELLQSPRITEEHRALLGPLRRLDFTPNPKQAKYLRMHNQKFEKTNGLLGPTR